MTTLRTIFDASCLWGSLIVLATSPIWASLVPVTVDLLSDWVGY